MSTLTVGTYTLAPAGSVDASDSVGKRQSSDKQEEPKTKQTAKGDTLTAVTIEFSSAAQLYGKLENLADNDPDRFRKVTSAMAESLRDVAQRSSGTEAKAIKNLAAEFEEASRTGKANPLAPAAAPNKFNNPYAGYSFGYSSGLPSVMAQAVGKTQPSDQGLNMSSSDWNNLTELAGLFQLLSMKVSTPSPEQIYQSTYW
jgi:hypothetical protein